MRRYVDVIKTFSKILLHFSRAEHQNFRFAQVEVPFPLIIPLILKHIIIEYHNNNIITFNDKISQ